METELWAAILALCGVVGSMGVYINRTQATRIEKLEAQNEKLQHRLEGSADRNQSITATLERVVNASVDRERELMARLAEAQKGGQA